jgi:hypothetical protein
MEAIGRMGDCLKSRKSLILPGVSWSCCIFERNLSFLIFCFFLIRGIDWDRKKKYSFYSGTFPKGNMSFFKKTNIFKDSKYF